MPQGQFSSVLQHIRKLVGSPALPAGTDGELLQQFVLTRDEAAFTSLVQKYGPLVWNICRRVLRDPHAAEDAFQATFLVLARKAGSIRKRDSGGSWLYGVAYRVAVRARTNITRRQALEQTGADMTHAEPSTESTGPADRAGGREIAAILDEELQRLPEKHRAPLVLCYLQGQTNEQAAAELRCPPGSMSWRLSQAREQLRARLARRGVALSTAGLGTLLTANAASATVPGALVAGAVRLALSGAGSSAATALAEGVLHSMGAAKMKSAIMLVLTVGVLASGLGILTYSLGGAGANTPPTEPLKELSQGGQPVDGLALKLTADHAATGMRADGSNAEPVKLTLTFRNVGDRPLKLDTYEIAYRSLRLQVKGPDARSFDEEIAALDYIMPAPVAKDFPELAPGKEWAFTCSFPGPFGIDRNFILHRPGTYRLHFQYTARDTEKNEFAAGRWLGTALSNELELHVKGAAADADGFGAEVGGLRSRITLPREKFTVGEAIPVTYVIKNFSKDEQTTWHSGFWPNHMIVVKDADGKEPPLTERGRQVRKAFAPEGGRDKNAPVKLKPGAEDSAWTKYDLQELYDLSKPGRYTVQYVYQEGALANRLPSNVVNFEIVAR